MSARTVRFEEVKATARRTGVCPVCGRKVTRTETFTETISPLHPAISPDMGRTEARAAVRNSVAAAAAATWELSAYRLTHQACAELEGGEVLRAALAAADAKRAELEGQA